MCINRVSDEKKKNLIRTDVPLTFEERERERERERGAEEEWVWEEEWEALVVEFDEEEEEEEYVEEDVGVMEEEE